MFGVEQIEIASADLVKILVALDGRPWPSLARAASRSRRTGWPGG